MPDSSGNGPAGPRRTRRRVVIPLLAVLVITVTVLVLSRFTALRNVLEPAIHQWEPREETAYREYLQEVKPILQARCFSCHGGNLQKGGLRLDTAQGIVKGGRSGAAIAAGQPEKSLLLQRLTRTDDSRMPKEGAPLSPAEIARIDRWIRTGASAPAEIPPGASTRHWAFQAPRPVPIPAGAAPEWRENPIDAFVGAEHRKRGLRPVGPIDAGRLLRRLTIDLTGLPPTLEELQDFLRDSSPEAYLRHVDRLLSSPRYGERWARHWMDVWRYCDEDGRLDDKGNLKDVEWGSPFLWRWRDWIVRSLNQDKGYDRMIVEMIAGDEVAPGDSDVLIGTGFLARNYYKMNRELFLSGIVEHASKAFLGLTLNCARCHDHKFDPITQEEYYRLRAFFEPLELRKPPAPPPSGDAPLPVASVFDAYPYLPTYLLDRGDPQRPIETNPLKPGIPQVLGATVLKATLLQSDSLSTGRRLALANWLVAPGHPLTARVAVNHVWARHFGRGLVPTLSDFGVRGKPPSHPELLDWLALEFSKNRWSQKWLHRLIVTSKTYQLHSASGGVRPTGADADPEDVYLWRFPSRRLEAEVIRDALLHLAGRLDETMGGEGLPQKDAETSLRRSLYFRISRQAPVEFLCQFDPASLEECYERTVSILPQQALAMMNSELVWRQAGAMASRLPRESGPFIESAFLLALCRKPSLEERAEAAKYLSEAGEEGRTYLVHAVLNHNDFITLR